MLRRHKDMVEVKEEEEDGEENYLRACHCVSYHIHNEVPIALAAGGAKGSGLPWAFRGLGNE